jgi:hypothetical protein
MWGSELPHPLSALSSFGSGVPGRSGPVWDVCPPGGRPWPAAPCRPAPPPDHKSHNRLSRFDLCISTLFLPPSPHPQPKPDSVPSLPPHLALAPLSHSFCLSPHIFVSPSFTPVNVTFPLPRSHGGSLYNLVRTESAVGAPVHPRLPRPRRRLAGIPAAAFPLTLRRRRRRRRCRRLRRRCWTPLRRCYPACGRNTAAVCMWRMGMADGASSNAS